MRSILLNVGMVFLLVWGLVLSATVYAASFTCVVNGRVFSSQAPCFSNSGAGAGEGVIDRSGSRRAQAVKEQGARSQRGAARPQEMERIRSDPSAVRARLEWGRKVQQEQEARQAEFAARHGYR